MSSVLVVALAVAACAHEPFSRNPQDCGHLLPTVREFVARERAGAFVLACGGEISDDAGRKVSGAQADDICRRRGCMRWSVARPVDAEAASNGDLFELRGVAEPPESQERPVVGFEVSYWILFDRQEDAWTIRSYAIKSIT